MGAVVGCGVDGLHEPPERLGRDTQAFVNGGDDRLEYFELEQPEQRAAVEQFTVALMTRAAAAAVTGGRVDVLPTWGQVNRLCDSEPFVDQPSAAFCSGVLVDWNLVLTSGHCVDTVGLENLRVAFGYYYRELGELAMSEDEVYGVERVIVSARAESNPTVDGERLDFAWLELSEGVRAPHRPAPIHTRTPGAGASDRVISIGAGGGVPVKWDEGGRVQDTRAEFDDYMVADTDTSQGSSGGGLFDERLAVLGSLARGAVDFSLSPEGCFVTDSESNPAAAREQFTYAHRAVEALCATGSTSVLCDPACEEPCDASALGAATEADGDSGCALSAPHARREPSLLLLLAACVLASARRRRAA